MNVSTCENNKFLIYTVKNMTIGFSTAENNLNFNKFLPEGHENLEKLKKWFNVEKVVFLNQVHGIDIHCFDGEKEITDLDGDGVITNNKKSLIGVFTADCVPVIIVDEAIGAMAAIHSGWKGTLNNIVLNGIKEMMKIYGSKPENMKAFIGPHNKVCCYEVSEDLIELFKQCEIFKGENINEGRNLNLQRCVEIELVKAGIIQENIIAVNLCTYCSEETKLFSYRKEEESKGRLFSFVFANEED
ncbi:MAG: peptidoglycan editing factor PgeF [Clostridium sp.]|uniref:peptidoglycan editing factor PgeF n=1 Tax=Clostridium culturomicium TaxID=1499683 RepID=UPI00058AF80E|nr:peptidoglycan editing factor PgeF [Clostridium culturomicium]MDU4889112.1 peptidoglycan editing factor PgeF [Clostridium sp.]MDU7083244.1 peptidoglycan editing factor PgeF [Clostridium sp.]